MQGRKSVPLSFLQEDTNWDYIDTKQKDKTLWELGFNTVGFNYKQTTRRVFSKTKMKEEVIIEGFERMDKQWLNKRDKDYTHYASDGVRNIFDNKRYGGFQHVA